MSDKVTSSINSINVKTALTIPLLLILSYSIWIFYSTSVPPADFGSGSMFDQIAPRYDLVNRVLSLNLDMSWRRTMVKEVLDGGEFLKQSQGSPKVLDLATGTADVAILLGKAVKVEEKVEIIGVDPSHHMIDIGRTKVFENQLNEIVTLQIGNVLNLQKQFKPESFDAVTMAFGIRNVPDRATALCQIHRVLKKSPNNKLFILEFSEPPQDSGISGFFARYFIRYVVPVLGSVLSGAPREYMHLQNSIKEFPSSKQFVNQIEELKCNETESSYRVSKVHQMNFGTVQLYVILPL